MYCTGPVLLNIRRLTYHATYFSFQTPLAKLVKETRGSIFDLTAVSNRNTPTLRTVASSTVSQITDKMNTCRQCICAQNSFGLSSPQCTRVSCSWFKACCHSKFCESQIIFLLLYKLFKSIPISNFLHCNWPKRSYLKLYAYNLSKCKYFSSSTIYLFKCGLYMQLLDRSSMYFVNEMLFITHTHIYILFCK